MADRTVNVRLTLDIDQFVRAAGAASVATAKIGKSGDGAGREIDKLSGRLRLLTDAALVLGPALIPIGASALPVLTSSMMGFTAAAGGITTAVLAFQGLGDGLKALDKAQLEPTVENLEALRVEMDKLGPAGAHFVQFLDDLEPVMSDLQMVARAGLFPGVEDGIDGLLTRLPRVRKIVADLALGMGDLARDAGESLGGPEFNEFFRYIETDARPTLEAFARSAGNVALGLANMLVAFAPANRDFTSGLEDATKAFADWSKGLDDNESFQDFLAYVRESGPAVVDLLSALVSALAGLVQAAAPMGKVLLPALTGIAKAFAAIASSPIGPALYTAATAFVLFNRAAQVADKTTTSLSKTFGKMSTGQLIGGSIGGIGLLAASLTDLDDKAGLANTTMFSMAGLMVGGPWGLAVGAGIGAVTDLAAANNDLEDATRAANDAMNSGDLDEMQRKYADLGDEITETAEDSNLAWGGVSDVGGLGGALDKLGSLWSNVSGETDEAKHTFNDLGDEIGHTVDDVGLFATGVLDAADSVEQLSDALSALSGWFDKRAAIRDYRDSIKELAKSIRDGFGREDLENLDAVGENIIKVANSIKDPALRQDFMTGAINSLNNLAQNAGPKAQAQIQKVIDKMTELGLAKVTPHVDADTQAAEDAFARTRHAISDLDKAKAAPTLDADDSPFRQIYGTVKGAMQDADRLRAKPKIDADAGNSLNIIGAVIRAIKGIDTFIPVTVSVSQVGKLPPATKGGADGGTVPGARHPYGDKMLMMAAPGEEIISNRFGQADRFRADRAAGLIPGYAGGGAVAGNTHTNRTAAGDVAGMAVWGMAGAAKDATTGLKGFKAQLEQAQAAVEREKQSREDLIQASKDFAAAVGGAYAKADPFAGGLTDFDTATAANFNDTTAAQAALAAAAAAGLDGPLYQALASSGNLALVQEFATLSAEEIARREEAFAKQSNAQGSLGSSAANAAGFTQAIKDQTRELKEAQTERKRLARLVNRLEAAAEKLPDKVEDGARKGVSERERRTRVAARTGGG